MKKKITYNSDAKKGLFEAFNDFVAMKYADGLSEATIRNYRLTFDIFAKFFNLDENAAFDEIDESCIYKWIGTMKSEDIATASIQHYIRDIRVFLNWCMKMDYLEPFEIHNVKAQEESVKLYSDEDLEKLLEKPRSYESFSEWRMWTIVNHILATGNRASTICEMRVGDINFASGEIRMRHTKNKKAQSVPLSDALNVILKDYIKTWRKDAKPDDYLYPNIGDEGLTTNALRQSFERYCAKRNVERASVHSLRHNFSKGWIKADGSLLVLQQVLGHSTLQMTQHYVKMFSDDLKKGYSSYSPLDQMKKASSRKQIVKRG